MDIYRLEGLKINSLADFHEEARRVFDFGEYYGANIYALRDFLSTVNIPVHTVPLIPVDTVPVIPADAVPPYRVGC